MLRILFSDFLRDMETPIATPRAMPTASQKPPVPRATDTAAPIPAPSAIPRPICIDGLFISRSSITELLAKKPRGEPGPPRPKSCCGCTLLVVVGRWKRIRFRRVISDQPHLGEQFVHVHSRKRFKQSRHLRRHLGNVAGNFVHAGG